jgi:hypothetical protein
VNDLKLQIIEGPNAGQELELDGPGVIGRDPAKSHLLLEDPEASRRHASLIPEGQSLNVEDLGSTNGTFVNGQRIADATVLVPGDRLRIGTSVLEVVMSGVAEPAAPVNDELEDEMNHDDEPRFAGVSGGSPEQPPAGDPDPGGAPEPPATPPPPAGGATPEPDAGGGQPGGDPGLAPPPPAPPPPTESGGPLATQSGGAMQTRDSIVEWLLSAFVPFYSLYWFYRANKEIQAYSGGRIDFNAGTSLVAITLGWIIIVPPFVAWSSYMGRIREAQRMAGLPETATFWGSVLRAFLLSYNIKWHQDQFNEIAVREPQG